VPGLQALEGRQLLAAAVYNPVFGTLHIDMNAMSGNKVTVGADTAGNVTINGSSAGIVSSTGQPLSAVSSARVTFLSVRGTRFNDTIDLSAVNAARFPAMAGKPVAAELNGDNGADTLTGTRLNDRILGGTGDDTLKGLQGDDSLEGNTGKDKLYGGEGRDTLNGGDDGQADYLEGGSDSDLFIPEWYIEAGRRKNRDQPYDLKPAEGDRLQGY
jgi:Ca2+-binding RTX toxin-like protein